MPKYLCLQRSFPGSGVESKSGDRPSPAQMQAMYEKFNEWKERFKKNLTDLGGRLGTGRVVGKPTASDGPFIEVKELVGGYMIVTANDIDEAAKIAAECPGLVRPGSGVEVIEIHTP